MNVNEGEILERAAGAIVVHHGKCLHKNSKMISKSMENGAFEIEISK